MNPYLMFLTPFIAAGSAQFIKILIGHPKKLSFKDLFRLTYAGMPSGHSAFVSSLTTLIALIQGFNSPIFLLSLVFTFIVINDALKLRRYLGKQGEVINTLIKDLKEDQFLDEEYPLLLERIGHTKIEALVGSLLGILVSLIMFFLIDPFLFK